MGTRTVEQPYCDADHEDVKETKTFAWQEAGAGTYAVELGAGEHPCYDAVIHSLDSLRPRARRIDLDNIQVLTEVSNELAEVPRPAGDLDAADEGEPTGEDESTPVPTAAGVGSRSSSEMSREERVECRVWWRRKYRSEKLPEPPDTDKGRIPVEVIAAWDRHKAKLSGKEPTRT